MTHFPQDSITLDVDPTTPLLYVLSDDLELRGPKFGCGLAQCGACTVIAGGRAIRSCVTPVGTMGAADIITLEGLGTAESPHPIQRAFIDEQATQWNESPQTSVCSGPAAGGTSRMKKTQAVFLEISWGSWE